MNDRLELVGRRVSVGHRLAIHRESWRLDSPYAVLSFGGFLGMGEKLFAVPWSALTLDTATKSFKLNVDKDRLKTAPGFDKDHWPNMADATWAQTIHTYYGTKLYSDEPRH